MDYILTHSGKYWFDDPAREPITIQDLAGPLSRLCRFTGHTRVFYSVAQHSVMVAKLLPQRYALRGLLHDGAEAFLGDVSSPLKDRLGEAYRSLERPATAAIFAAFGVPENEGAAEAVHHADMVALATEKRDLMPEDPNPWAVLQGITPDPRPLAPWSPEEAEANFIATFHYLTA